MFQQFILKVQDSIQQINSFTQVVDNLVQKLTLRSRHAHVIHMLDWRGTLRREPSGAHREPLRRLVRGVALAIGISLCFTMNAASSGSIDAIQPKHYIRLVLPKYQANCLITLYSKESAFNPYAIGNLKGKIQTYGIPQIKNPLIADKTPIQQIDYGIKYIKHRYQGDACIALHHFKVRGWH